MTLWSKTSPYQIHPGNWSNLVCENIGTLGRAANPPRLATPINDIDGQIMWHFTLIILSSTPTWLSATKRKLNASLGSLSPWARLEEVHGIPQGKQVHKPHWNALLFTHNSQCSYRLKTVRCMVDWWLEDSYAGGIDSLLWNLLKPPLRQQLLGKKINTMIWFLKQGIYTPTLIMVEMGWRGLPNMPGFQRLWYPQTMCSRVPQTVTECITASHPRILVFYEQHLHLNTVCSTCVCNYIFA